MGTLAGRGWLESLHAGHGFRRAERTGFDEVVIARGQFFLRDVEEWDSTLTENETRYQHYRVRTGGDLEALEWAEAPHGVGGFRFGIGAHAAAILVPGWSVVLASVLLPVRWLKLYHGQWMRMRRRRRNQCIRCGYGLDASPKRCPECGALPMQPVCIRMIAPSLFRPVATTGRGPTVAAAKPRALPAALAPPPLKALPSPRSLKA